MAVPPLPLELVETVLSFLRSDPKSLKAASLASIIWVPICRRYLFRRIVLHWCDEGSRRSDSLYFLLTHAPYIAEYIHELSIHEGLIACKHSRITFCFAYSSSLPKLLSLLPQLRLIEFRASTLTPWFELSGELVRALLHAITTRPTLTRILLGSWNFTSQPRALDALLTAVTKNAKSLALTDIVTPFEPEHRYSSAARLYSGHLQRHAALQSLVINEGGVSSLPFLTKWFRRKTTGIKDLQLSCSTNQTSISPFLSMLGDSLEHLELNVRIIHGDGPVNLGHNTRLQSLHLQASDHPLMSLRSDVTVSWLVDVLSTLRSFESLEVLHISFGIDTENLRRLAQSDAASWRHLDQILCPKRYHRLTSVQFRIKFQCHDGLEYVKEAQNCMTNLHSAGILGIHTEAQHYCCVDYC